MARAGRSVSCVNYDVHDLLLHSSRRLLVVVVVVVVVVVYQRFQQCLGDAPGTLINRN